MSIEVGDTLPDFRLETDGGRILSNVDLIGKKLVLYFYPKDNTSGCTKEAEGFRDLAGELQSAGTQIVGVSRDSVSSHDKFKSKYGLNFPLLSDPDVQLAQRFGIWVEKSMYGRKYMGMERSTFLFDGGGVLRQVWRKVKVTGHAEAVLKAARDL